MPGAVEGIMANEARLDSLSTTEARALALRAQGFGVRARPGPGRDGRALAPIDVLDLLGAIQLDSVNVVARTQDLVPFARLGPCSVPEMWRAVYAERRGFEYWGHAASWLPMAEYRYFRPRMAHFRERHREYREAHAALLGDVLARIRDEGPLGTAAFEDPRPERGTWWDWKPAKQALEVLFADGDLSCAGRTAGFARLYDLTERVLPAGLDTSLPDTQEAARYLLLRAISALGVATVPERPTTSGSPAPSDSPSRTAAGRWPTWSQRARWRRWRWRAGRSPGWPPRRPWPGPSACPSTAPPS